MADFKGGYCKYSRYNPYETISGYKGWNCSSPNHPEYNSRFSQSVSDNRSEDFCQTKKCSSCDMYYSNGEEEDTNSIYCGSCGEKVKRTKFCSECGERL